MALLCLVEIPGGGEIGQVERDGLPQLCELVADHRQGGAIAAGAVEAARGSLEAAATRLPPRDAKGPMQRLYEGQMKKLDELDRVVVAAG